MNGGNINFCLRYVGNNGWVYYKQLGGSHEGGPSNRWYAGILPIIYLESDVQLKPGAVVDATNNIREWNFVE